MYMYSVALGSVFSLIALYSPLHLQNNETPLHLASKFGYEDIVAYLVALPPTDTGIMNRDGKTAADVACTRARTSSQVRIQDLINSKTVKLPQLLHT